MTRRPARTIACPAWKARSANPKSTRSVITGPPISIAYGSDNIEAPNAHAARFIAEAKMVPSRTTSAALPCRVSPAHDFFGADTRVGSSGVAVVGVALTSAIVEVQDLGLLPETVPRSGRRERPNEKDSVASAKLLRGYWRRLTMKYVFRSALGNEEAFELLGTRARQSYN